MATPLAAVFNEAKVASGLELHPEKGVVVPLADGGEDWSSRRTRRSLALAAPQLSSFRVARFAKYLGFCVGPGAASSQWGAPLRKWREESRAIAAAGMPVQAVAAMCRRRALPVLAYVSQLTATPAELPEIKCQEVDRL